MESPWTVVAAATTLFAMLAALKWRRRRRRRNSKDGGTNIVDRLPPGPPGLPVVGNLLQLRGSARLEEKLLALSRQHGPLMLLQLGSLRTVIVNSPEMARHIYKDQDKLFSHRPKDTPNYALSKLLYFGYAFHDPHGPAWKFLVKKQMAMEFLTDSQMQKCLPVREREFGRIMNFVRDFSLSSPASEPPVMNLSAPIAAALLNAVTQQCWSKRYCTHPGEVGGKPDRASMLQAMEEWIKTAYSLVGETSELISTGMYIGDVLPSLWFLDVLLNSSARKRVHDNFTRLDAFFQGLVDDRRSQQATLKPRPEPERDVLDSLLSRRDDAGKPLSDTTIKGGFQFAIINLTDSLESAVEWTLAELLANPEHLERVYEELDAVVGRDRVVRESDLADLPFLRAAMKEAWRMHPPAPISPPHFNPAETEVAGYRIPARTNVIVNIYGIGRDPAVWPEPDRFMPQRFMSGDASHIEGNGQHMELLVFGSGLRQCVGMKVAPRVQGLLLARFLHSFHLRPCPEHPVCVRPTSRGVVHKLGGHLLAIPSPRLPPHLYNL